MNVLQFNIITLFTVVVIVATMLYVFFVGRKCHSGRFPEVRKAMLWFLLILSMYIMTSIETHSSNNRIEVIPILSFLVLYILFETFFFLSTSFLGRDYVKTRWYWFFLNHNVVIITILFLVLLCKDKYIRFYSISEFFHSASCNNIYFFARVYIQIMLVAYIIYMIYLIYDSVWCYVKSQKQKGNIEQQERDAVVIDGILFWTTWLTFMFLGKLIYSPLFHSVISVVIVLMLAKTMVLYYNRWKLLMKDASAESEFEVLELKINKWLQNEPFPLVDCSITMDDVASSLSISRDVLSRYFSNLSGVTFASWISRKRIEHCKYLLTTTDMNLSQVAYQCGYADLPTMSKAFKKRYGIPPSKMKTGKQSV